MKGDLFHVAPFVARRVRMSNRPRSGKRAPVIGQPRGPVGRAEPIPPAHAFHEGDSFHLGGRVRGFWLHKGQSVLRILASLTLPLPRFLSGSRFLTHFQKGQNYRHLVARQPGRSSSLSQCYSVVGVSVIRYSYVGA